jgi:hypothetical protein
VKQTHGFYFTAGQRPVYRPRSLTLLLSLGVWGAIAGGIVFACAAKPAPSLTRPDSSVTVPGIVYPIAGVTLLPGDSLKVKLEWTQPTDGQGVADSTLYRLKLTKPWRFYSDTLIRPAGSFVKRKRTTQTADSLKLLLAVAGDSVDFTADSIRQCRKGVCSVPGSAAFHYVRNVNPPPSMTFLRVTTDSF